MKIIVPCLVGIATLSAAYAPVFAGDDKKPARISDVIYGRKDGLALTMDVFRPTGKPNGAAVVLVASGGFKSSASEDIRPIFATEFLKRGYTCFYVVHGSQPRYTVPEIRDDINRAVRFARYHAKKFEVDPNRIGIGGVSSGGLLALLVGTAPQPAKPNASDPVDRVDSNVQAVAVFFPTDYLNFGGKGKEFTDVKDHGVPFRAPHDFREFDAKEGVYRPITDKTKVRAIYKDISPIYHVTAKTPPTLLFHGDKDELVPFQQSESFYAKLKEAGVPCDLKVRAGAGHGWFTMLTDLKLVGDWYDKHLTK